VEIFHKAVDWALRYDEFFDPKQVEFARKLLLQGSERLAQLRSGQSPWLEATGLVVRAYRSKLDNSIQPYGLVIPPGLKRNSKPHPLYVWLAGRNEKRTELAFLNERQTSPGSFTPADAIVLHPYGRFCNATKFAGEIDVFEAIEAVRSDYSIDMDRMVVAGFSMGGASAWHLATHHPSLWCAASPGAGFAETALFAKAFDDPQQQPLWWEQKLWKWYDATAYAANLFNCPTIAYSGEIDPQKQAADVMERFMAAEGLKLERLIGPQTGHKYHPETRDEIARRLDSLVLKGRNPMPTNVWFTTCTLRYPGSAWVRIEQMGKHWERADVRARVVAPGEVEIVTTNVHDLSLFLPSLRKVTVDKRKVSLPRKLPAGTLRLSQTSGRWAVARPSDSSTKRPGLTGPIDDAFMEPFLFVRPTGKPLNPQVGEWTQQEFARAVKMWRDIFRGEPLVQDDVKVTSADVESKNLVLWGDPSSNKLLRTLLDSLPISWTAEKLEFKGAEYDAAFHAPIFIFPNPLNRDRYVVLNSGIDFRKDAYGSNARQTPKLPDWTIIDLRVPPGPRWPGRIAAAGFFNEQWQ
jgi:pimeloyl-ACP methyl ester carboxylesterase